MDFGVNPVLDPNPGAFWRNFTIAVLAMVNVPHRGFGSSRKIHSLADVRLRELKAALVVVCGLRMLLVYSFLYSMLHVFIYFVASLLTYFLMNVTQQYES